MGGTCCVSGPVEAGLGQSLHHACAPSRGRGGMGLACWHRLLALDPPQRFESPQGPLTPILRVFLSLVTGHV